MGEKMKRIMRKFKITEISAVDRPAQAHAVSVIMKRHDGVDKRLKLTGASEGHSHTIDVNEWVMWNGGGETSYTDGHSHPYVVDDDGKVMIGMSRGHTHDSSGIVLTEKRKYSVEEQKKLASSGEAMEDGAFPVVDKADLLMAIRSFDSAVNKAAVAQHIALRASAIGLTSLLPDEGELSELIGKSVASGDAKAGDNVMPNTNDAAALQKAVDKLEQDLKVAKAEATLCDAHRAYYKSLDDDAKTSFLAKSEEERDQVVKNAKSDDPVVYKCADGTELRKSVGEYAINAAKRADALEKKLEDEISKRKEEELTKRAETELNFVKGDVKTRVALLKAVDGIKDESTRSAVMEMLKSKNNEMSHAFETHGVNKGDVNKSAAHELDNMAKKYAEDNSLSYAKAYSAVLNTPEGRRLYDQTVN